MLKKLLNVTVKNYVCIYSNYGGYDMTIKELRTLTGLSQQAFSDKYEIPKRTIEDWETGRRKPPEYVVKLLERIIKEDID